MSPMKQRQYGHYGEQIESPKAKYLDKVKRDFLCTEFVFANLCNGF